MKRIRTLFNVTTCPWASSVCCLIVYSGTLAIRRSLPNILSLKYSFVLIVALIDENDWKRWWIHRLPAKNQWQYRCNDASSSVVFHKNYTLRSIIAAMKRQHEENQARTSRISTIYIRTIAHIVEEDFKNKIIASFVAMKQMKTMKRKDQYTFNWKLLSLILMILQIL